MDRAWEDWELVSSPRTQNSPLPHDFPSMSSRVPSSPRVFTSSETITLCLEGICQASWGRLDLAALALALAPIARNRDAGCHQKYPLPWRPSRRWILLIPTTRQLAGPRLRNLASRPRELRVQSLANRPGIHLPPPELARLLLCHQLPRILLCLTFPMPLRTQELIWPTVSMPPLRIWESPTLIKL